MQMAKIQKIIHKDGSVSYATENLSLLKGKEENIEQKIEIINGDIEKLTPE